MSIDFRQSQEWKEYLKQLQGREPSPKHKDFMDKLFKYARAEGKQVARVGCTEPPTYCIVDDALQPAQVQYIEPYDLQPTERATMKPLRSAGLVAAIMSMLPSMAYTHHNHNPDGGYGVAPSPQLIASKPDKPRRRNHTNGGTHKQNLRASKRKGKSYKVRAQRRAA